MRQNYPAVNLYRNAFLQALLGILLKLKIDMDSLVNEEGEV